LTHDTVADNLTRDHVPAPRASRRRHGGKPGSRRVPRRSAVAAGGFARLERLRPRNVDVHVFNLKILQSILDAPTRPQPFALAHVRVGVPELDAIGVALIDRVLPGPRALARGVGAAGGRGRQVGIGSGRRPRCRSPRR